MTRYVWPLVVLTVLCALLLVYVAGCNESPAAGRHCDNPGSVYAHHDMRGSVVLTCDQNGVWQA